MTEYYANDIRTRIFRITRQRITTLRFDHDADGRARWQASHSKRSSSFYDYITSNFEAVEREAFDVVAEQFKGDWEREAPTEDIKIPRGGGGLSYGYAT